MSVAKYQLNDFYIARGVGIKRREKMIKTDLNSIKRYVCEHTRYIYKDSKYTPEQIEAFVKNNLREWRLWAVQQCFDFNIAIEGRAYWQRRSLGSQATTEYLKQVGLL